MLPSEHRLVYPFPLARRTSPQTCPDGQVRAFPKRRPAHSTKVGCPR